MSGPSREPDTGAIGQAVETLQSGGLVAMPTETVYGLAADGTNAAAVARIYEVKQRPSFNPLIAHVARFGAAQREGVFNAEATILAQAFWPGPLTLVLPAASTISVCPLARAGLETVALRVPSHPVARALVTAVDRPVVAPSANRSGGLSPVTADAVAGGLGAQVDLVLDGGRSAVGVESTIIDCTGQAPVVLRPGGIPHSAIEGALGAAVARSQGDPNAPSSPGQLLKHYAPAARLRMDVDGAEPGEGVLGFGVGDCDLNLSERGDVVEAAANLFEMLRALDARFDAIAVRPVPEDGVGEAINDRLRRAASR